MSKGELQPEQVRQCREGLRLSQPKFGERIGVGRVSVYQYEHGRRHDTQQPITISQTVNMACGAAWIGIDGYTSILDAAGRADQPAGGKLFLLPNQSVEPRHEEAAIAEVKKRGFANEGKPLAALPLLNVLAVWSHIQHWYAESLREPPKLHPVISASVPAVAVLEFAADDDPAEFKMRFNAGK